MARASKGLNHAPCCMCRGINVADPSMEKPNTPVNESYSEAAESWEEYSECWEESQDDPKDEQKGKGRKDEWADGSWRKWEWSKDDRARQRHRHDHRHVDRAMRDRIVGSTATLAAKGKTTSGDNESDEQEEAVGEGDDEEGPPGRDGPRDAQLPNDRNRSRRDHDSRVAGASPAPEELEGGSIRRRALEKFPKIIKKECNNTWG